MIRTTLRIGVLAGFAIAIGILSSTPVDAKRYRFYCQGDHLHYGTSTGHRTRRHAMRAAIENWAGFTIFEYGENFGDWRISKNKRVNCSQNKFSKRWNCSIQSTPCRRG